MNPLKYNDAGDLVGKLVDQLRAEQPAIQAVYLFGSWDTPDARPESDIDLAVLAPRPLEEKKRWALSQELALAAHRDIDLLDLLSASTVMRFQIVAHGRRVYCADEAVCANFESWVFSAYARFNEERREILQDIRQRGRVYA